VVAGRSLELEVDQPDLAKKGKGGETAALVVDQ
jgi:hypothetical protein